MEVIMEAPDGDREIGVITVSMPLMDVETRTGTVRAVMTNRHGEWKPGAFVTGHVRISADDVPVVVPLTALQTLEGEEVIFVEEDGAYIPIPVVTGRRDRDNVEVKSGLKNGEAFVAKGAFELKAMMVTSGLGSHAGHGH
jgi:cobalt-zinc-cadmium efflux system membrane fusion protein